MGTLVGRGGGVPPMPMDLKYMGDCGEGIGVPVYWQNCRGGIGVAYFARVTREGLVMQ